MPAPTVETVSLSSVAEAKAFLKAQAAYDEWKRLFERGHSKLVEIARAYNATLKAADKVVREKGVTCGPFELYTHVPSYDPEVLYASVGRQRFAALGGEIEAAEARTIDKERFLALLETGKIDPELAEKVVKYSPRYHAPKAIEIP